MKRNSSPDKKQAGAARPDPAGRATRQGAFAALKSEIARIARKEAKSQVEDSRKAASQSRSQIAALRRRVDELERELRRVAKGSVRATASSGARAAAVAEGAEAAGTPRRFSATRLAAQRQKLGLSAADFAALLGVSGQSIYKWEHGESRPRARQLEAIAGLRGVGKREAAARLEKLQAK